VKGIEPDDTREKMERLGKLTEAWHDHSI